MKYFKLIRSGIDVAPLLEEVRSQEQAWLIDTGRQDKIRVQRDTNTIFLSAAVHRPDLHINENQETRLTSVSKLFPKGFGLHDRVRAGDELSSVARHDRAPEAQIAGLSPYRRRVVLFSPRPLPSGAPELHGKRADERRRTGAHAGGRALVVRQQAVSRILQRIRRLAHPLHLRLTARGLQRSGRQSDSSCP